jgi:hypothetical protein
MSTNRVPEPGKGSKRKAAKPTVAARNSRFNC